MGHGDAGGVGAQPKKGGMPEADHATVAEDQVQAGGRDGEDHDADHDPGVKVKAASQGHPGEGDQCGQAQRPRPATLQEMRVHQDLRFAPGTGRWVARTTPTP